jgi:protein-S-isoprenylcysteine O-methyltransferase Ste14
VSEAQGFSLAVLIWCGLGAAVLALLFFITAPYGRFARKGWGPTVPARTAWVLMESSSALVTAAAFALGNRHGGVALVFFAMWQGHYLYRAWVFPFLLTKGAKPMPLSVVAMGASFNLVNATLNGLWLFRLSPEYSAAWLTDPRFVLGSLLFFGGMATHLRADKVLRSLRPPGQTGYRVPFGGLYRYVSCPNYFGEMVEWAGFALATWSLPGLSFALWTVANLLPRALSSHRWYQAEFADYPKERRAVIPFVL